MLIHYFKMAVRQLLKYKFHTFVSVLCMAVGLTINGYIGAIVKAQFSEVNYIQIAKRNGYLITYAEYKQIVERQLYGVERFSTFCNGLRPMLAYNDNIEESYEIIIRGVSPDFFRNYYDPRGSLILEGRDSIGENEVVICDKLADKIFGDKSPLGNTLTLLNDSVWGGVDFYSGKSYRIVGVCKNIHTNDSHDLLYIPMHDKEQCSLVYAYMEQGSSRKCVQESFDAVEWKSSENGAPYSVIVFAPNDYDMEFWLSVVLITLFSLLIFATGLINYMKFMIQMFYTRQRELALRKCLGSSNSGLYLLLASEVVIVLSLSFFLSCVTTELSLTYLHYLNISLLDEIPALMIFFKQLETSVIALLVALVVILFPIIKLRRASMRGSILRRRQGSKMRNFMLGLQFVIAVVSFAFLGYAIKIEQAERGRHAQRMSNEETDRIIAVNKYLRNWDEIRPLLEKLPCVEDFTFCDKENISTQTYRYREVYVKSDSIYADIIAFGDPHYFEFLGIPVDGKIVTPHDASYVYIDKKLHRAFLEYGDYDGTVQLDDGKYTVAGIINNTFTADGQTVFVDFYGEAPFSGSIFMVQNNPSRFYFRIKEGVAVNDAKKAFKEIFYKFVPKTFDIDIKTLKEELDIVSEAGRLAKHIAYIMAFISLMVVVLSVYSTISLDAETRQKEVAVRKINGATGRDIFQRFVSPYIVNFTISFLIIYPLLSNALWNMSGAYQSFLSVRFLIFYGIFLYVGILALLAIITRHRIKMIMCVNPAEAIRRE